MKKSKNILLYSIYILLFISLVYSYIYNINFKSKFNDEKVINGVITYYIIDGNKLTIKLNSIEKIICTYYFNTQEELNEFKNNYNLGDYIKLEGSLTLPSDNTIFNTFNYREYLKYEGISYIFNINNIYLIRKNTNIMYKIKGYISNRIDNNINKDYLYTFILGNTKYIDSDVINSYRINGISHLFSVSGMHISLISLIILKIFDKIKIKNIILTIVILFYMFLTNYSPSILRSGIFFIILLLKKKFKININNIHLMILLLSICIFIDPYIIYKIGFQYSYIISFTLILFNDVITRYNKIKKSLLISFISFIVSLPITINNFYQINLLSIFLNLIFVPIVSTFLFPITLLSIIIPIPYLNNIIDIFEYISVLISKIDIFIITLKHINILIIIIYYIIIFYVLYSIKSYKYNRIILLILLLCIHMVIPYIDSNTIITYLDVGQGDSIFIKFPNNNANILIDTGGSINYEIDEWKIKNNNYSISSNVITYIKSLGINKLDYLILTHGDTDHMGESINLINNFNVSNVIFNCGNTNNLENKLINLLDEKHIKYYSCIKDLNIKDTKLEFINNKIYDNENDNSSVIYTKIYNYKFLFMADASVNVENNLIKDFNLNNIDVLKVGHHGSKTSSGKTFINKINPKYSIISVGEGNRYSHPHKEVLDNLENTLIYRTDVNGSIMFKINKKYFNINTCLQ